MTSPKRRQLVLHEFVETEQNYLRDLHILASTFLTPLKARLSPADLAKIFCNLEMLIMFHEQLVESLQEQETLEPEKQSVGACILKYADFMKLYSLYCSNMSLASGTLKQMYKVPPLAEILRDGERNPVLRGLTIGDFIIKPVQRVMKYPLLLKELIESTDPEHSDKRDLEAAQAKIGVILDKINSEKRESEAITVNQMQLKELQQQIEDIDVKLLDNPTREFIRKSTITRIIGNDKQELTYFLFNDLFLVCKNRGTGKYQQRQSYALSRCLVRPFEHTDFPEAFELLQMDNKDKIHQYGVTLDDKLFLINYLQEAVYTQTLHINHIVKVKYEWFLENHDDRVADLVFCFRLFCSPQEFLQIFDTEYSTPESGKDILLQFIDGLEARDFEVNRSLSRTLEKMVNQVQNSAVQAKMVTALKKARRSLNRTISTVDFKNMTSTIKASSPIPRRSRAFSNADLLASSPPATPPPRARNRHSLTLPPNVFSMAEAASRPPTPPSPSTSSSPTGPPTYALADMMKPVTIAQCITRRESKVLRAVRPQEILAGEGPNLNLLLELSTWTPRWISTKILSHDAPEKRGLAIAAFISVAQVFRDMHNYNGVSEVLASLHSTPIASLKDSWKNVPGDAMDRLRVLDDLMSPVNNFKHYREALALVELRLPVFPSVAIFLADVTAIEVPELIPGEINMNYVKQVSGLLRAFRSNQKNHHKLSKSLPWIYGDLILKDEEIETLAAMCNEISSPQVRHRGGGTMRFNKVKRKSLYLNIPQMLNDATTKDWDKIMAVSDTQHYASQVKVMDEKGSAGLFLIVQGHATMSRRGVTIMELGPGDFFASFSLLNRFGVGGITVVAKNNMEVKQAKNSYVRQLLETDPELAARFYKFIARLVNTALQQDKILASKGNATPLEVKSPTLSNAKNDSGLNDFFQLREDEIVIKTYNCKYGRVSGKLSVSKNNLFFVGKTFGLQKQKQIPLFRVSSAKALKHLEILEDDKIRKFHFKTQQEVDEAAGLIGSLFDDKSAKSEPKLERIMSKVSDDELNEVISSTDWQSILKGTSNTFYPAGSTIFKEGDLVTALFQVTTGMCAVTKCIKGNDGNMVVERIGIRKPGDIFGEASFLDPNTGATVSVVALTDVDICNLDFHYVTVLLGVYKHIAPKFYKYLALLVHKRLMEFEQILNLAHL